MKQESPVSLKKPKVWSDSYKSLKESNSFIKRGVNRLHTQESLRVHV